MEHPFSAPYRSSRPGFTTLELLLVISVFAVLLVLAMPAFSRVRQQAYQVRCISHLKQMGIAMNFYADDHQHFYPATFGPERIPADSATWMTKLAPYAGFRADDMGSPPLPRSTGIFVCPAFPKDAWQRREVSYRYNSSIVNVWLRSRKAIPFGKIFLIVEAEGANTELYFPKADQDVARRHPGNAANFLFTDGRVETYREAVPVVDRRWGQNRNADYQR